MSTDDGTWLNATLAAAEADGRLLYDRPELKTELSRVDGRLRCGVAAMLVATAPGVQLLVKSVLRDAPQHREGRAVDLAFRRPGALVPSQRGRDPRYNESREMLLALIYVMEQLVQRHGREGAPGIVIESDHIHLMTGNQVEGEVWAYQGVTTYTSDDRFRELERLAGAPSYQPPLRLARDLALGQNRHR